MCDTKVDMPKVTQMLDNGWAIYVFKNPLGSYTAKALHHKPSIMDRVRQRLIDSHETNHEVPDMMQQTPEEFVQEFHFNDGWMFTDFTPEQALTRLAYKAVDGVIL